MFRILVIIASVFFITGLTLNHTLKDPEFDDLPSLANYELNAYGPERAEGTLYLLVLHDSLNVKNHYNYIVNHFAIPKETKVDRGSYRTRDDQEITDFYKDLTESEEPNRRDIGWYGMGLIQVEIEHYTAALNNYLLVSNHQLPYLNNSMGHVYMHWDSVTKAERFFRKEIEYKGNLNGAYLNLSSIFMDQNRMEELEALIKDPTASGYIPNSIKEKYYFRSFRPLSYFRELLTSLYGSLNWWGVIAAFLIMGSWVMYLRRIDLFEAEKWVYIVLTVAMGMLFSLFTFPLSDMNTYLFGLNLNGKLLNDFAYSVLGIGMVEELVKIIPLLLLIRYTKEINEPFDYILYASLSALGFAFMENLIYFDQSGFGVIHSRALFSTVEHMFLSSIIAYGILLNRFKNHRNSLISFFIAYGIAAFAHGFYDFWLLNSSVRPLSFITTLFFLTGIYVWNSMKNNALNQSVFFDRKKGIDNARMETYLMYSLSAIFLFEYISIAFVNGPTAANRSLEAAFYSGTYFIFFLTARLGKFTLMQGEWAPLKVSANTQALNLDLPLNMHLKIERFTNNYYAHQFLPNSGTAIKRIEVSGESDWYLMQLDKPVDSDAYRNDKIIFRSKEREEQVEEGSKVFVALFLIPKGTDEMSENLTKNQLDFSGWAICS